MRTGQSTLVKVPNLETVDRELTHNNQLGATNQDLNIFSAEEHGKDCLQTDRTIELTG